MCAADDGAGLFFAWHDTTEVKADYDGRGLGAYAAAVAREVGPDMVAQWNGAGLTSRLHESVEVPRGCSLPSLPAGSPVVVLRVKIPQGSNAPVFKEERQAGPCPDGEVGAAVLVRSVKIGSDGQRVNGVWRTDSLAGCRVADAVAVTVEEGAAPVRSAGSGSEFETALAASLPDNCKRVTLTHRKGRAVASERSFNTCDFAALPEPVEVPEAVEVPKPPREHPPVVVQPPCPVGGAYALAPEFGAGYGAPATVASISDALAPWLVKAAASPAGCPKTIVYGSVWWPYYQTFRADWNGQRQWAVFTRRYQVVVNLWFEIAAGTAATTERHSAPSNNWSYNTYTTWTDFRAFPSAFKSGAEQWMYVQFNPDMASFSVWSMDGRSYPNTIGPRVGPSVIWPATGAPYPYPNAGAAPWGDTLTQASHNSGISYAAFGRERFRYHGGGAVRDYPAFEE